MRRTDVCLSTTPPIPRVGLRSRPYRGGQPAFSLARDESFPPSLVCPWRAAYIPDMNLKNGTNVVADLVTTGRKTGQPRTVELRFFYRDGKFYATSGRIQGKHWCQNMLKHPDVRIKLQGETLACSAKQITDEALRKEILSLRDSPPQLERVVFEITPER